MKRNTGRFWFLGSIALLITGSILLVSLLTNTQPSVAAQDEAMSDRTGEELYNANCAICHGVRGTGDLGPPLNVPPPPEVRNLPQEEQAAAFLGVIRDGIPGKMPGFTPDMVSEEQSEDIRAYLKTLQDIPPGESLYDALEPVTAEAAGERAFFPETGHSVGEPFATFWQQNGGLRVFGYPLSEDYLGVSSENGQVYRMQLFERARFELHEDRPAGEQVVLSLLGGEELDMHTYYLEAHE